MNSAVLTLGLELAQKVLLRFFHLAEEFRGGVEAVGIFLDARSKLFRSWIVEDGVAFVQMRDDDLITDFFDTRHQSESATDNGFGITQDGEGFGIEQLDSSGLQERGDIAWAVIGLE